MATTTKREIAERVAQQTGLAQVTVKQVVQLLFDEIISELAGGNRLEFRDFGVFEVVVRKPRTGRNPKTGEKVAVPPKRVVTFKMGKIMKEKVATPSAASSDEAPAAPAAAPVAEAPASVQPSVTPPPSGPTM
jgi:integration host factor subunit beta